MIHSKKLYIWVTFLQMVLLLTLAGMEYYSGYRAGLAQHLYFKKIQYTSLLYKGTSLLYHGAGLLLPIIILAKKFSGNLRVFVRTSRKYFILLTLFLFCLVSGFVQQLNIYAYLLIVLEVCLLLEFVYLLFLQQNNPKAN